MEYFFSFLFLLSLILCVPVFIYIYIIYKPKTQQGGNEKVLPLPPGRTGWPLIGEAIDYISKVKNGVPQDFVTERIKKYSSEVFKTSLLCQPIAILHGAEGNKFLFCDQRVRAWLPGPINQLVLRSLCKNNHEGMKNLRKKLTPFISGEGLHKSVGKLDTAMRELIETSLYRVEIKVSVEVKKCTLKLALWFFFSVDNAEKLEKLSQLLDDLLAGTTSMLPVNLPGTAFGRAVKASKLIIEEIEGVIKQRKIDLSEKRATPTKDVLSHILLTTDENGQFQKEFDIAFSLHGVMLASYDTLNTTLTFIMKYLAELPDVYHEQKEIVKLKEPEELLNWDDLRKMRYSWNVACEVLRLRSLGIGTFREAIVDCTYAGFTIPKGWKLHSIPNSTHMNPKYFRNPENFDPSRFDEIGTTPYTFVPFGGGPRMCHGNEYEKAAILVFMHKMVTNFKWEKLIPNEKVINGPFPKCSEGLPIRLHPHKQEN